VGGVAAEVMGVPYDGVVGGVGADDPDGEAVAALSGGRRHESGGEVAREEVAVALGGAPGQVACGESGRQLLSGGERRHEEEEEEAEEAGEGGHGRALLQPRRRRRLSFAAGVAWK